MPITTHERIHRRAGHVAVSYDKYMLVWGGYMEHEQLQSNIPPVSEYHYTEELWVYDPLMETWSRYLTTGDIPPKNSGSCGVIYEDSLFIFGGYLGISSDDHDFMDWNSNQLFRLDLHTMTWEWLHPTGVQPMACDKLVGWVYKDQLYFFGGFGPPSEDMRLFPQKFQYVSDPTTRNNFERGWNNQLVVYNIISNEWLWPRTHGPTPLPRAAHAGGIIDDRVYIFGGRHLSTRMNDFHCLDLKSMTWSGNLTNENEPTPEGRSWHSLTFISENKAVLYGGFNQYNTVLSDCWQVEFPKVRWIRCEHYGNNQRLWHAAVHVIKGEVLLIGGIKNNIFNPNIQRDHAEDLLTLRFTSKSLLRLCLDTVIQHADLLEKEWSSLPKNLQQILKARIGNL